MVLGSSVALSMVLADAPAAAADMNSAPGAAVPRQVLYTGAAPPYTYELALENCAAPPPENAPAGICAFAVRLLQRGRVLDRIALDQAACGPPATPMSVTEELGADPEAKAFGTTDERCDIDVAARTVALAPDTTALLITQIQGFEYRYRNQAIYGARQGKLEVLWHLDEDIQGAERTETTVIPGADGHGEDVALVELERSNDGVVQKVETARLHLDRATGSLRSHPLPDAAAPVFVLAAGGFKNSHAAHAARQDCLSDLVLMRARLFPTLRLPPFFWSAIFVRRHEADLRVASLSDCPRPVKGKIFESTVSGGGSHGGHQ